MPWPLPAMNNSSNHRHPTWLFAATSAYLIAVFFADLLTPAPLAIWSMYLPLSLLQLRFSSTRRIAVTDAAAATLMTLETYLTNFQLGFTFILANLVMRVVALWSIAIAGLIIVNNVIRRKELEYEVLQIAGDEQQRIGRELHDSVGQELTGLGLMANALDQQLQSANVSTQISDRLTTGISRVQDQIRT